MLYSLESEPKVHLNSLKVALEDCKNSEPDLFFITEDGSKVFTQKILLSMYSSTFRSILTDFRSSEVTGVSLPGTNPLDLLNLFKILSDGMVFSSDSEALLNISKVAKLLGIVLENIELEVKKSTVLKKGQS